MSGHKIIWSWRVSNGISRSLDTEISTPYPESWGEGIPAKAFAEGIKENAWVRVS